MLRAGFQTGQKLDETRCVRDRTNITAVACLSTRVWPRSLPNVHVTNVLTERKQHFDPENVRRMGLIIGWCLIVLIIYGSLSPSPITQAGGLSDKSQHFLAYCITMAWFAQVLASASRLAAQGIFMGFLAIALEYGQTAVSTRVFEPLDMLASVSGVVAAAFVPKNLLDQFLVRAGLIHRSLN